LKRFRGGTAGIGVAVKMDVCPCCCQRWRSRVADGGCEEENKRKHINWRMMEQSVCISVSGKLFSLLA